MKLLKRRNNFKLERKGESKKCFSKGKNFKMENVQEKKIEKQMKNLDTSQISCNNHHFLF